MAKINLNFTVEDHLPFKGTVTFPSDFSCGYLQEFTIGGLGEWRNVNADTVHLSDDMINNVLNPVRKAKLAKVKNLRWIGLKAKTHILLSASVREKKETVKKQLELFFTSLSSKAKVVIQDLEDDGTGVGWGDNLKQ
jgi:hypothetical protein